MGNVATALLMTLGIGLVFILTQRAVLELNPSGPVFYDCAGTVYGSLESSHCSNKQTFSLNDTNPSGSFPAPSTGSGPTGTTSGFTDIFSTAFNWLLKTTGLGYIIQMLSMPKAILLSMGVPSFVSNVVATMWWAIVLFLLVSWMFRGWD